MPALCGASLYSSNFYVYSSDRLVLIGYRRRYPLTIKTTECSLLIDPQRLGSASHTVFLVGPVVRLLYRPPHTRAGRALQPPPRQRVLSSADTPISLGLIVTRVTKRSFLSRNSCCTTGGRSVCGDMTTIFFRTDLHVSKSG